MVVTAYARPRSRKHHIMRKRASGSRSDLTSIPILIPVHQGPQRDRSNSPECDVEIMMLPCPAHRQCESASHHIIAIAHHTKHLHAHLSITHPSASPRYVIVGTITTHVRPLPRGQSSRRLPLSGVNNPALRQTAATTGFRVPALTSSVRRHLHCYSSYLHSGEKQSPGEGGA